MTYKEAIEKGKKELDRMIHDVEVEIYRLKDENRKLRNEIERLKEAKDGKP